MLKLSAKVSRVHLQEIEDISPFHNQVRCKLPKAALHVLPCAFIITLICELKTFVSRNAEK